MALLLDTHHHFDFLTGAALRQHFLTALAEQQVRIVAQTLLPSDFLELVDEPGPPADPTVPRPLWSVGLHPWSLRTIDQATDELSHLPEALTRTRFVGEVGLDLSPRRLEQTPAALQRQAFQRLLELVLEAARHRSSAEPSVLSIHAVRATGEVLDLLESLDVVRGNVVPVLHRFSGTSDELTRLVRLGGFISVHPQMLASKRGRAYARQVPVDRLLLESDLPADVVRPAAGEDRAVGHEAALAVVDSLRATLEGLDRGQASLMAQQLAKTQELLYGIS